MQPGQCSKLAAGVLRVAEWDPGGLSMMVGGFPAQHGVPAPAAAAFACQWVPSLVLLTLPAHGRAGGADAHSRMSAWGNDA